MISRSVSVIVWAKFGRGAMRRRTKVGMQRTLQPRIRQKVKQPDRGYRSAHLQRVGPKGPFQCIRRISRDGRGPAVVVERDRNAGSPICLSAVPGLALD